MNLYCVHCPGRTDHTTADCPTFRSDLYADSAQARAGTELRQAPATSGVFDWQAAQQRRELEASNMRVRVLGAIGLIEMKLGMAGKECPP